MKDKINSLYITEQSLLKSCTEKLVSSSSEIVHDNILSIFDNIDDINRKIFTYLEKKELITNKFISKKKKDDKYEELDSLLLQI